jgi:hypothetical protein
MSRDGLITYRAGCGRRRHGLPRSDDPGSGEFQMLEALETLALGIQGKAALWRALAAASGRLPEVQQLDFAALEERARNQFQRVDTLRLKAAPGALSL